MKYMILLLCLSPSLWAADLPQWARQALDASRATQTPEDADFWVLLDETRIQLRRDGRHRQRRRLVTKILTPQGVNGSVYTVDGDAETTKIKKLKGWHQYKTKVTKLDKNNVMAISSLENISSDLNTVAYFSGVKSGSVVAFESDEIIDSYFPRYTLGILGGAPTLKKVIELEDKNRGNSILQAIALDTWNLGHTMANNRLELNNLPAIPNEVLIPNFVNPYPRVLVGFSENGQDSLASWDHLARWYYQKFSQKAWEVTDNAPSATSDKDTVFTEAAGVRERIAYRQVYLSAARGWEPIAAKEVERLAYGDCKDMVSCLTGNLRKKNISSFPALTSIGTGFRLTEANVPQSSFNHVIAAIALENSMGLPAEVEVGGQRYLLTDPTDRFTPMGYMSGEYAGRSVLICTPEGARWVEVPKASLAPTGVTFSFEGHLDSNFTFVGMLTVEELGDAWGLYSTASTGNTPALTDLVRRSLDLPGMAFINLESQTTKDAAQVFTFQLQWPNLLRSDLGAYRLPYGITGHPQPKLTRHGKDRFNPVYSAGRAPATYHFKIQSDTALQPGQSESQYQGQFASYDWKASGGNNLEITFSRNTQTFYFPLEQLKDADTMWQAWRNALNAFLLQGPLFTKS